MPEYGYYGLYRGLVWDNADPLSEGRLRIIIPVLFGTETPTGWAWPVLPWSGGSAVVSPSAVPPDIGAQVWVLFEQGDALFPVYIGMVPVSA